MHYETVNPVENIFNKFKDFLEYGHISNYPYFRPQVILKAYDIIDTKGNLRESIKSWNSLPPIQKAWIAFKNHLANST